ncbi:hypothetical protein [Neobacillus drentensis]|uniref:hypothetical protein n=1 Tax=Neobacillus drentensis TaxID=220684 RepID=UPI002FFE4E31
MFLRKDATKHLVIRVDKLIRKTTIYAKIASPKTKKAMRRASHCFRTRKKYSRTYNVR